MEPERHIRQMGATAGSSSSARRAAMTLLELIIATTIMTTVTTVVALVLRGGHTAWRAHHDDAESLDAAVGTLRHLVRHLRQASAVQAISSSSSTAGTLSVLMSTGQTFAWARDAGTNEVRFGVGTADQLLAEGVTELRFTGYQVDGATTTTVPDDIHSINCRVSVVLQTDPPTTRVLQSRIWLRSW